MTRLAEIRARVAEAQTHSVRNDPLFSDLEFALGEIERLQRESDEWEKHSLVRLVEQRERLRAALKGISKLGNLTLLGGSAMDSERAHEAGAHEAFSQAADIARSALGADYVQEG